MKIVKIETTDRDAKVYLENGETLEGLIFADTKASVDKVSVVTLKAYVYNEPKKAYHRYVNIISNNEVLLTEKEKSRFFDNRDPRDWKSYD